jgi:hypothetical protein
MTPGSVVFNYVSLLIHLCPFQHRNTLLMEHKPYIVPGEAPESDSEEEVNITVVSI